MLTSGDVVELDLGAPHGREAGFVRPGVVVTAQRVLRRDPAVIHVVPLTSTLRRYESEVVIEPDDGNGLGVASAAQCQHLRAVSAGRLGAPRGNVGTVDLARIRDTVAMLLDLPT
jgi:mRNA-degrading endonuclease toxin of MazEF toxin-antitoxin module